MAVVAKPLLGLFRRKPPPGTSKPPPGPPKARPDPTRISPTRGLEAIDVFKIFSKILCRTCNITIDAYHLQAAHIGSLDRGGVCGERGCW